jgi:hypothetical protein
VATYDSVFASIPLAPADYYLVPVVAGRKNMVVPTDWGQPLLIEGRSLLLRVTAR